MLSPQLYPTLTHLIFTSFSVAMAFTSSTAAQQIEFVDDLTEAAYQESVDSQIMGREISTFLGLPFFFDMTRMRDASAAFRSLGLERTMRDVIEDSHGNQDYEEWEGQVAHPVLGTVSVEGRISSCTAGWSGIFSARTVYSYSLYVRDLSNEKSSEISDALSSRWGLGPDDRAWQTLSVSNPEIYASGDRENRNVATGAYFYGFISFHGAAADSDDISVTQSFQCD